MILVATKISQVPDEICASKFTDPPATPTFQTRPAVDPFKSGEETSVNVALEVSQVE